MTWNSPFDWFQWKQTHKTTVLVCDLDKLCKVNSQLGPKMVFDSKSKDTNLISTYLGKKYQQPTWKELVDHAICWPDSAKPVTQINSQHSTSDWFTLHCFASFWKVMCSRTLKMFKLWCFCSGCFKTWCSRADSADLSSKWGFSNCWKWWCYGQW